MASPSSSKWLLSLLLSSFTCPSLAASKSTSTTTDPTCYSFNGTPNSDYQLCPQTDAKGMCCLTGTKDQPADVCLQNGLCQTVAESQIKGQTVRNYSYWRGYCTSRDWEGGGCLGVCLDGSGSNSSTLMTPCDNTRNSTGWCCGGTTDCCGTPKEITLAAVLGEHGVPVTTSRISAAADKEKDAATSISTSTTASTSTLSSTSTSTSTSTSSSSSSSSSTISTTSTSATSLPTTSNSTPSPTPAEQSTKSDPSTPVPGISNGVKAGIGVAVSIAALFLFVAAMWLLRRHRTPKIVSESREYIATPVQRELVGTGRGRGVGYSHAPSRGSSRAQERI